MENWFEDLCGKYLEETFLFKEELHPFKKISHHIDLEGNFIVGRINYDKYNGNRVKIRFKKFSDTEKKKLTDIVDGNLINTYTVINETVPEDLLDCGINVLPESLDDLEIECSGDDENQNKIDILSVLKVFNKKLREDNFLIFKIKDLDLKRTVNYHVKTLDEIFTNKFKTTSNNILLTNLRDVNATLLKDLKYNNKSFDFIYNEMFEIMNNQLDALISGYKSLRTGDFYEYWSIGEDIQFNIDENYELSGIGKIHDTISLLYFMFELNDMDVSFNHRLEFLKESFELTYLLLSYNAMMPELFVFNDTAQIRWIPSFYDENVMNYCKHYYNNCPDDLILFNNHKISKQNQLIIFTGLIMDALVKYCFPNGFKPNLRSVSKTLINLLTGNPVIIKSSRNNSTIVNISKKFHVFRLNELDFKYVMFINKDLEIEIKIKDNNGVKELSDAEENELKYMNIIYDLFTQFNIKNTIYNKIQLSDRQFIIFTRKIKPLLKYINVEFHAPFNITESDLKLIMDCDLNPNQFNYKNLKRINWIVELDDGQISLEEFYKLSRFDDELLKTENTYYITNRSEFMKLSYYAWSLLHTDKSNEILKLALLGKYIDLEFEVTDRLKKLINPSHIYDAPASLTGDLRPYQKIGYSWLVQNIKSGFGSILADDMGLGKTLQVLSTILHFKETKFIDREPTLIIVPPTLLSNWEHEIKKFTPDLTYYIYHGKNRTFPLNHYDIILTSYAIIRLDLEKFMDKTWFICVIDEAQNIKNPSTQQTRAIKNIDAFNKIALTGTPIENRLSDYWSIFDFTNKGYLSSLNDFTHDYITPIERNGDENTLENLKTLAKPFVLRRLKSDEEIRKDLPEKTVNDIYTSLNEKQIRLYNSILNGVFDDIDREKGIKRKAMILKTITSLKQICNHPAQYSHSDNAKINESGKMELLITVLENILDADEKVLIFTQYVKMGEIIQELISKKFKREILFLHGSQNLNEKTGIINTFQEDEDYKILVATLKTGGTGLNLTAAQNVIHYDLWWNPAVENQATDRVHRIGQENNVTVYRFITKGTLEEGIDLMIKNKLDLAKKTISNDETFITEMTTEELREILSLRF